VIYIMPKSQKRTRVHSVYYVISRDGSGPSQMGGNGGSTIPAGGPQYAAELRILLVCLSESLGRLGQNGGHIFHWGAASPLPP